MPSALPPPEPRLYVRGHPIYKHIVSSEDSEKSRIYVLDWAILAYLLREKWEISKQLAFHFKRSGRTINKHLRKLERIHLMERHGRNRCCFQWYSFPRGNEYAVAEIVGIVKGRTYVLFTVIENQASHHYESRSRSSEGLSDDPLMNFRMVEQDAHHGGCCQMPVCTSTARTGHLFSFSCFYSCCMPSRFSLRVRLLPRRYLC